MLKNKKINVKNFWQSVLEFEIWNITMDLTTENTEDSQRNTEGFITQNSLVNLSALSAYVVKQKM